MRRARRKRQIRLIYFKCVMYFIILLLSIGALRTTIARYRSSARSNADVNLAYYFFKDESISQELKLESILPREEPYTYTFSVANNDGTDRTETAIEYVIQIKTTTNLPLNFKVYNQEDMTHDLVTGVQTVQDSDGTYFKYVNVQKEEMGFAEDEQKIYTLQVEFPKEYNRAEYEGIIEYVEIKINSSQKI